MDDEFTARAGEYWPRLTRTARLLTGHSADAERLARAALAEVYARRRTPRDDAEFYVRRALVRGFLRSRTRPFIGSRRAPEPYAAGRLDPLTEVLAALPPRRRAVAVLHHWDGLSHREIAALLNSSPGAVKAHGRRALKDLRAHPAYGESTRRGGRSVPGPVQPPGIPAAVLPAVEEAGRTRRRSRRRTTAVLTTVCALLLVPLALGAVRGTGSDGGGGGTTPVARASVRVVTAGERVAAAPGVELWLTKDGKHWSTPKAPNQFRPADKGSKGSSAAITLESDPASGTRLFHSGVLQSVREPSRVQLTTPDGTFTARILTLAGSPGWSVWYADTQLPDGKGWLSETTVKAYDSAGKLLTQTGTS
ncbi:sigma factor-like helix-turn-helix DNA-binding protein [Streptomyces sp. ActVer]|uniref:sigma factor-like helix-turn-helix DNA-binding protein n=1 Tax=Streptomyces sp. ActVer TaxID=3014558 RepID=UPI0022B4F4F9|nr:sigma factor-like helix-turn-helix DNA-binding protein [Streptomyces sp. ActVer]MCZ4511161.1 sigma factor-like helix-turn-helix DNA-binding protein [Streptomyces sp. ActVer]